MGDDFDVEDISMRNYADDLDIAPMELMIVVCAVCLPAALACLSHAGHAMALRAPH